MAVRRLLPDERTPKPEPNEIGRLKRGLGLLVRVSGNFVVPLPQLLVLVVQTVQPKEKSPTETTYAIRRTLALPYRATYFAKNDRPSTRGSQRIKAEMTKRTKSPTET